MNNNVLDFARSRRAALDTKWDEGRRMGPMAIHYNNFVGVLTVSLWWYMHCKSHHASTKSSIVGSQWPNTVGI